MKVDRYYDVQCSKCGRNLSTDYGFGLFETRNMAIKVARKVGFKTDEENQNICPCCAGVIFSFNGKKYKVRATDKGIALQQKEVGDWNKEKDYYLSSDVFYKTKDDLMGYALTYLKHYDIDYIEKNYGS